MSQVNKIENKNFIVIEYILSNINDIQSAVEWMENVKNLSNLIVHYISLSDLNNRNDEGNTSKQLPPDANKEQIYKEIKSREIDDISITGKYKDRIIAIGVNLNNYKISISTRNKNKSHIEEIAKLLRLND